MKIRPAPSAVRTLYGLLCLATVQLAGCWQSDAARDKALEARTHDVLGRLRAQGASAMPLRELLQIDEGSLCVQRPYMTQQAFESDAHVKTRGFDPITDDSYVWWVFQPNGRQRWIVVPRVAVADLHRGFDQTCIDVSRGALKVSGSSAATTYSFEE